MKTDNNNKHGHNSITHCHLMKKIQLIQQQYIINITTKVVMVQTLVTNKATSNYCMEPCMLLASHNTKSIIKSLSCKGCSLI